MRPMANLEEPTLPAQIDKAAPTDSIRPHLNAHVPARRSTPRSVNIFSTVIFANP